MALANYAVPNDVSAYLPNVVQSEESAIWTSLLSVASRDIDRFCDRYFYPDTTGTKYFDGNDSQLLYCPSHDFYSLTALKVARYENADPAGTDWITFDGNGLVPPSNFFCEPANETYVGTTGQSAVKPFYKIVLPTSPSPGSSNYLTTFTGGRRTVAITASWGWPTVPDEIKDITVKLVIRMWKAKDSGWTGAIGDPEGGPQLLVAKYLDVGDLHTLDGYRRHSAF